MPIIPCLMERDMVRGYKIRLHPNESQQMRLDQLGNNAIDAYNWCIETIEHVYDETGKFTRTFALNKIMSDAYQSSDENIHKWWMDQFPSSLARRCADLAIRSFELFFRHINRYPKFKSKRREYRRAFHIRGTRLYFHNDNTVTIEGFGHGLQNRIKCNHDYIPKGPGIKYYNCVVTRDFKGYWLSVNVGYKVPFRLEKPTDGEVIGIDLGVRKRAALSNGTIYKSPNTFRQQRRYERKAIRYGRDRKRRLGISQHTQVKYADIPKTKNEIKREYECQCLRRHIADIHHTYNHTMTREIVNTRPKAIVIETLDVRGLIRDSKNKKVTKAIRQTDFYGIARMLEYKADELGIPVIRAAPDFPSSQICSRCGGRHKSSSSETYHCPFCDYVIDRDINAAINLSRLG